MTWVWAAQDASSGRGQGSHWWCLSDVTVHPSLALRIVVRLLPPYLYLPPRPFVSLVPTIPSRCSASCGILPPARVDIPESKHHTFTIQESHLLLFKITVVYTDRWVHFADGVLQHLNVFLIKTFLQFLCLEQQTVRSHDFRHYL